MKLEVACFSYRDALLAIGAGADRIEFCRNYRAGGLTPSLSSVKKLCASSGIPIFVMIRPHARSFVYSASELAQMKTDIRDLKSVGCAGFVFGILDKDGIINKKQCSMLVKMAAPLPCTFHRAFDRTSNPEESLEALVACGFERVLTSGGIGNAIDNLSTLKKLVKKAGKRIGILPGGGVRSSNISGILSKVKCKEFHSAAIDKTTGRISIREISALRAKLK